MALEGEALQPAVWTEFMGCNYVYWVAQWMTPDPAVDNFDLTRSVGLGYLSLEFRPFKL